MCVCVCVRVRVCVCVCEKASINLNFSGEKEGGFKKIKKKLRYLRLKTAWSFSTLFEGLKKYLKVPKIFW